MKLLTSLKRELTLLSRSIYFYCEIAVACVFLVALLVVIPENFDTRATEYLYFNAPDAEAAEAAVFEAVTDYTVESVTLKNRGEEIPARLYTTEQKYQYVIDDFEAFTALCGDEGHIGTVINAPGSLPAMEFYLQGNETERYTDYALLALSADTADVINAADAREIRLLEPGARNLTDRQSVLPMMLTVNSVIAGIFIAAAYIMEDKKTKVIKALRVLPVGINAYLIAKVSAVMLTALAVSAVIAVPIMRGAANYPLLFLTILCGGFMTTAAGALIASFADDIQNAMSAVFVIMMALIVPCITSVMPAVDAAWLRLIPSFYVVESIKMSLLGRDAGYILICCAGFFAAGLVIMPIAAKRYKAAGIGVGG